MNIRNAILPPHSMDSEKALLGALLVENRAYDKILEQLSPEHFYFAAHSIIFEAIQKLIERGRVADPIILGRLFERMSLLDDIGGREYLGDLVACAVTIINAAEYSRQIYDYYRRRELIRLAAETSEAAHEEDYEKNANTYIENLEEHLYQLSDDGASGGDPVHISIALDGALEMAREARESDGDVVGASTGLIDLDALLGGLRDTNLYILAGRPSMGKSALGMNIARYAAEHYGPVAFFSLEMSKEQLAQRLQSDETQINSHDINLGKITPTDMQRLDEASEIIGRIPLFIDDTPAINTSQLRSRARRAVRKHGVSLIIVDYLQLLQAVGVGRDAGPVVKTTAISGALKALAKELRVPVLALSQLSRAVEHRDPPRPILADLRESGSIEQDADVVMFIYREEYYFARKKPEQREAESDDQLMARMADFKAKMDRIKNLAEVIVAKQRHGPVGNCMLIFDGPTCKFSNAARTSQQQDLYS